LQGLVDRVEDESITALPNIPCDSNADRLILIRLGAGVHDVLCGGSREDLSSRKESIPNLLSTMTGNTQMVDIFIEGVAGAVS
jgi:hypothetical protein